MKKLTISDKNKLHGGFVANAIATGTLIGQMFLSSISKTAVTISNIINDSKNHPDPNGYFVEVSNQAAQKPVYSSFASSRARYSFLSPYASAIYTGF
ncbi:hypothetical protein [[Mycoplasma] imitans]|uniref:hypothetical protein n=1 Tax=[Mycoplasma] imitans TaxID=29560 RepID=UPI0004865A69|nr:hypothetical protein [[Mycoplasma] imitans]